MKNKFLCVIALALSFVTAIALSGCTLKTTVTLTDEKLGGEKLIDFADGANSDVLFESDGWSNGDVFNVVWKQSNVKYEGGLMKLGITEEKATAWIGDVETEFKYTAGEARTQNYYHYGDFEVSMKPSSNPGTASTFFTCTGPYDVKYVLDEDGEYVLDENDERVSEENAHDEIDIEFLGKNTNRVQFNFFVDGVGGNEYMYNLGFDASEEFHRYGYRWAPDSITWFVDGTPVYKVTTDKSVKAADNVRIVEKLPSTPGRILTNYWCGTEGAEGWMGKYNGSVNDNGTEYQWIATSAVGAPLNPAEKPDDSIGEIDWSEIDAIAPTFASTEYYTVVNEGKKSNVTYTNVGGQSYINVEMDITEASAGKNYLSFTVTNNAETACRFRVNVVDMALVEAGAQNMSTNVSATVNGEVAYTDLTWGGSFFDLEAGKTYEIVIAFSGEVEKLQLMPDSSKNDDSVNAGDITVENIKFAKVNESDNNGSNDPSEGTALNFSCEADTGYTLDNNNTAAQTVNVKYNGAGNTWKPITANVASLAAGNNTFTVTIKNNGTADARVRFDVQGTNYVSTGEGSGTDACNVSAVGGDVWTDLTWGGSTLTVAAGKEVTLVITYDGEGEHGAVRNILVFVDSARGDEATFNSDITLSGMSFTKVGGNDNEEDGNGGNESTTAEKLTFVTDVYTITPNNQATDTLGVTYSNISGGTYANVCSVIEGVSNNGTFTVTIKNNGTKTVRVRIDIKATKQVGNTNICNTEATGGGAWTDLEWGGSFVDVGAGQEVTVTVSYNTNHGEGKDFGSVTELLLYFDTSTYNDTAVYSGDLTVSNFKFSVAE